MAGFSLNDELNSIKELYYLLADSNEPPRGTSCVHNCNFTTNKLKQNRNSRIKGLV